MGKKNARQRDEGKRCALMPGECFTSLDDAEAMRVTRQINVATGGMGQVNYVIERCGCGRFHLLTDANFAKWKARRRELRKERGRNA